MGQAPVHLYDPINDFVSYELNRRSTPYTLGHGQTDIDPSQGLGVLFVTYS